MDVRRFGDGGIFVGNLRKPIEEVMPRLEKKLSEAAGMDVVVWLMEEKKDDITKQLHCFMASDIEDGFGPFDLNSSWTPDDEDVDVDADAVVFSDGSDFCEGDSSDSDKEEANQQVQQHFDLNLQPGDEDLEQQPQQPQVQQEEHIYNSHHKQKLSCEVRGQILTFLLDRLSQGKLKQGAINEAAAKFNKCRKTVSRLWNRAKANKAATQTYYSGHNFHLCGRKRIRLDASRVRTLTMGQRTCIRDLSTLLGISKSSVHRLIKRGVIRPHTNALKPSLKKHTKLARLRWVLSLLMGSQVEEKTKYVPLYDFVHLDEKWFYLTRKSQRYYLAQGEKGKHRSASSSTKIPKAMFTAVVAKPRFNASNQCTFDGKIGVFPFTYQVAAQRKSKNRDKGTLVTKLIESVNKDATRDMLINKIIPAIKAKWPQQEGPKVIFIQQDNARPHISQDDPQWQQVHKQGDFTFILVQQPANSPDLNILDLGFFRSIQSLMHKKMPNHLDAMMEAVHQAFNELEASTLNKVWVSLQYVMTEILKDKGNNKYHLPHVNKQKLEA